MKTIKWDKFLMMVFEKIYNLHFEKIYRFVYHLIGDQCQAEDITQETFVNLYYYLNKKKDIINPKSWLYQVAANLSKNFIKRKSIIRRILSETSALAANFDDGLEDSIIQSERIKLLRKALQKLSARDQILLQLYKDDLSYKEIAEITKIKQKYVGTYLSRAIIKCAKLFEKEQ